jgi:hypothetical protein
VRSYSRWLRDARNDLLGTVDEGLRQSDNTTQGTPAETMTKNSVTVTAKTSSNVSGISGAAQSAEGARNNSIGLCY